MKHLSCFLLFALAAVQVLAQFSWAPVGAVWHYQKYDSNGTYSSFARIEVTGDTVVKNVPCRKISGLAQYLPNSTGDTPQYVFTSHDFNEQTYMYDFNVGLFTPLFNYKLLAGDTFFFRWNGGVDTMIIQSRFPQTFNGKNLYGFTFTKYWIYRNVYEKFGYRWGFFPLMNKIYGDSSLSLNRCYQDSSGLYNFLYRPCDTVFKIKPVSSRPPETSDAFSISPNPSNGSVLIRYMEPGQELPEIRLNSPEGKILPFQLDPQETGSFLLHIPHYQGLVFVQLFNSRGLHAVQKILIR